MSPRARGLVRVLSKGGREMSSVTWRRGGRVGLTDRLVEVLVPHVVDGTACAAHHEGSEAE